MAELPFTPFSASLQDVLRKDYIAKVARWLLGRDENSILAQEGNSLWEAALTLIFLTDVSDIFEQHKEEPGLRDAIRFKSAVVARWLLSKRTISSDGGYVSWENVTWDTSVVIRGLLTTLNRYPESFSATERTAILDTVLQATKWLHFRFSQWETQVKYPFGPADVAQIVITIIYLARNNPDVYERACHEYYGSPPRGDITAEIIEYLLHKKTEKTLAIDAGGGASEDIIAYWWDDYFSTAEVVEALGLFHQYCASSDDLTRQHARLLLAIKEALIRACTYFEQGQVEGMWGSHIETIKVLHSYVKIRRLIPQRIRGVSDPLVAPEIHITFKALRWMCDEKQVFPDGSFLHTMFLTIFYALSLLEVYRSWEPAAGAVEKIYDDVVWFSPVRTTPERSKRLAAELKNNQLRDELDSSREQTRQYGKSLRESRRAQSKTLATIVVLLVAASLFVFLANILEFIKTPWQILKPGDFFQYAAVCLTLLLATIGLVWNYERIFGDH